MEVNDKCQGEEKESSDEEEVKEVKISNSEALAAIDCRILRNSRPILVTLTDRGNCCYSDSRLH